MAKMKNYFIGLLLLIIALLLIYIIGVGRSMQGCPGTHVDTLVYVDTIPYYYPVPKDSTIIKYISVNVPKMTENVQIPTDSVPKDAEIVPNDSVTVQIPITQKVYEDSTYKAYVSGFRPQMDSIYVFPKRQVVTIRPKPHRWHCGPSVGIGVGSKGVQPFVGVTLTYSIFDF